ncbi:MAG: hypothetical protein K0S65_4773 [Labilithrix sp.]|jgi:hypothetical protein|nr:hypothetical protein [Labilithrix sp.]
MRTKVENPFELYDLDPREGIAAITQRLKELAEDARDDAERERIRAAWEELTLHPARRLRAALFAHPETRSPMGTPPTSSRRRAAAAIEPAAELTLRELAARPSVLLALGSTGGPDDDDVPSLEDDPVLRGQP